MTAKLLFITIGILSLITCNKSNELEGHWHLYVGESDKYDQYIVLNIREDTIVDFDYIDFLKPGQEIGFLKNGKNIDVDSQFILLYNGMYGLYDYQLDGDRIILNERDSITAMDTDYWGLRVDIDKCNVVTDLFSREKVKVSLPKITPVDSVVTLANGFVFDILVGENKTSKLPAIQIGNNLVEQEDLSLEFEKFKIKIPESKHDRLILRLNIHEDLSVAFLGEQFKILNNFPFKQRLQRKVDENERIVLSHVE